MSWVDRLQEATGWHQERLEPDWAELESDLGTTLPEDYKELCARFEPGSFSGFVSLLRGGDDRLHDLRSTWRLCTSLFERDATSAGRRFAPYEVYGANRNRGLIQWGRAEMVECQYYWLADEAVDPTEWPVVGRSDPIEDWHSFTMSTAEFIYRVIADPEFQPLGAASELGSPFFQTAAEAASWYASWDPGTAK